MDSGLREALKSFYSTLKTKMNSDWNAAEGEEGYVKNRTHYESTESTTVTDTLVEDETYQFTQNADEPTSFENSFESNTLLPTTAMSYYILFDNAEEFTGQFRDENGYIVAGCSDSDFSTTNPFMQYKVSKTADAQGHYPSVMRVKSEDTEYDTVTHDVYITYTKTVESTTVHKLDSKYIAVDNDTITVNDQGELVAEVTPQLTDYVENVKVETETTREGSKVQQSSSNTVYIEIPYQAGDMTSIAFTSKFTNQGPGSTGIRLSTNIPTQNPEWYNWITAVTYANRSLLDYCTFSTPEVGQTTTYKMVIDVASMKSDGIITTDSLSNCTIAFNKAVSGLINYVSSYSQDVTKMTIKQKVADVECETVVECPTKDYIETSIEDATVFVKDDDNNIFPSWVSQDNFSGSGENIALNDTISVNGYENFAQGHYSNIGDENTQYHDVFMHGQGQHVYGDFNTSGGSDNYVYGDYNNVNGVQLDANGDNNHVEGKNILVYASSSHAEGIGETYNISLEAFDDKGSVFLTSTNILRYLHTYARYDQTLCYVNKVARLGETSYKIAFAQPISDNVTRGSNYTVQFRTQISCDGSHIEGHQTISSGQYAHAEGDNTTATHRSQHVFGEFNALDASKNGNASRGNFVEIVGNGENNVDTSNARTLEWSGNENLAGHIRLGSAGTTGGAIIKYDSEDSAIKVSTDDGTSWSSIGGEQTQTDWNQNDSTATDYIKNRTHYQEIEYEDKDFDLFESGSYEFGYLDDNDTWYMNSTILLTELPNEDLTCTFTVNGVEYSSKFFYEEGIYLCAGDTYEKIMASGGAQLWIDTTHDDEYRYSVGISLRQNIDLGDNDSDNIQLNVSAHCAGTVNVGDIHQLDTKFIPIDDETIISQGGVLTAVIPEQTQSDWNISDSDEYSFIKNRTHYANYTQHYQIENATFTTIGTNMVTTFNYFPSDATNYVLNIDGLEYKFVSQEAGSGYNTIRFEGGVSMSSSRGGNTLAIPATDPWTDPERITLYERIVEKQLDSDYLKVDGSTITINTNGELAATLDASASDADWNYIFGN